MSGEVDGGRPDARCREKLMGVGPTLDVGRS
jgi:hypothetical protein